VRTIREYLTILAKNGLTALQAELRGPVLATQESGAGGSESAAFRTTHRSLKQEAGLAKVGSLPGLDQSVIVVAKKAGAIYSDHVSVGRTRNNDIQLPYREISKSHAYFTWNREGTYFLNDARATNGSSVNGIRLLPDQPAPLSNTFHITLGGHEYIFYYPDHFVSVLSQLRV
jgi:hypothetical protein